MKENNKPINEIMNAVHGLFTKFNEGSNFTSSRQSPSPDFLKLNIHGNVQPIMSQEQSSCEVYVIQKTKRAGLISPNPYRAILENIEEIDEEGDFLKENLEDALEDLNKVVKAFMFDFCMQHLKHYEDYKGLYAMLAVLTTYADKLFVQNSKKIKADDDIYFQTKIDQLIYWKFNHFNHQTYLEFLATCYILHLALERVYFEYLKCTHDPIMERLFSNGFCLYLLAKKNIPPSLLKKLTYYFGHPLALNYRNDFAQIPQKHPFRFVRQIDEFMLNYNLWRLLIARFRRFYLNSQLVFDYLSLNLFVKNIEPFLQRFMSWFNFLYFTPRVLTDVLNVFYHSYFYEESDKIHMRLPLKVRFLMQVNHRWESFFRDMLWFVNSILSLFVLVGQYGFLGLYVNTFMQFAETLLNVGLYFSCKSQQQDFLNSINLLKIEMEQSQKKEVIDELQLRWNVDNQIRMIRLKNSVGVLLSSLLIMPCMGSISLIIPFCGAVLGLAMTFVQFKSVNTFNNLRKTIKDPFTVEDISNQLTSAVSNSTLILA